MRTNETRTRYLFDTGMSTASCIDDDDDDVKSHLGEDEGGRNEQDASTDDR